MKWSDIAFVAIIAILAVLAFRNCGKGNNPSPPPQELICPNLDSLVAVMDSLAKLPPDTVIVYKTTTKTIVKTIESVDTVSLSPIIRTYVTVNDTSDRVFVVDTLVIQGELIEHRQSVTFTEESTTISTPTPQPVEIRDTLKINVPVPTPTAYKWSVHAGVNLSYLNGNIQLAPAVQVGVKRFNFSLAKPLDNETSFIFQTSYRLFAR